jgi:hypothetical protein
VRVARAWRVAAHAWCAVHCRAVLGGGRTQAPATAATRHNTHAQPRAALWAVATWQASVPTCPLHMHALPRTHPRAHTHTHIHTHTHTHAHTHTHTHTHMHTSMLLLDRPSASCPAAALGGAGLKARLRSLCLLVSRMSEPNSSEAWRYCRGGGGGGERGGGRAWVTRCA